MTIDTVFPSYTAETSVLASLIRSAIGGNPMLPQFSRHGLKSSMFMDRSHRMVFDLIQDADNAKHGSYTPAVLATLAEGMGSDISLEYLNSLTMTVPSAAFGMVHLKSLLEGHRDRMIRSKISIFSDSMGGFVGNELLEAVETLVSDLRTQSVASDPPERTALRTALERFREEAKNPAQFVVPTQITLLDQRLKGGLRPGWMVVIAGRPGMGKSALAQTIGESAAKHSGVVAFYSLEMMAEEFGERFHYKHGANALVNSMDSTLYFIQSAGWTVEQINDDAMAFKNELEHKKQRLSMVIVDHIGLLRPSSCTKGRTREAEVAHSSRSIKLMAQSLKVPVIAVSQLNRGNESRTDRGPMLSDLRDSGSIEQDSDVVLGLFRPSYYDENLNSLADEIRILKIRQGQAGTIPARFSAEKVSWGNATYDYDQL